MAKKILLVEDDQAILDVVKIILETEGYEVFLAESEDEIHKTIKTNPPQLILLDIWLSGHDGGRIARSLKSKKETQSIPIVMVSANNATETITKASGADGFLLKPFNVDELLHTVRKHTERS